MKNKVINNEPIRVQWFKGIEDYIKEIRDNGYTNEITIYDNRKAYVK